ncbi:MAG: response regulator [Pseudonocardiales bacterium]|nr:response regulator [Pseudonocardiales bacterium]
MIRTLVVDDDYRVARIHAASVGRVPGFECVGEAHTAAQALAAVKELGPDLLLLDLYLPDQDGLSVMRSMASDGGSAPDCIVVTAARDIEAVRSAMQLGAVYYLVKPFGFGQLRDQLEAYRRWREQVGRLGEADQATVDSLYSLLRTPASAASARRQLPPTMAKVLAAVDSAPAPVSAVRVAEAIGISRPTAQRHLNELVRRGTIRLDLAYGATGRPQHLYRAD